MTTLNYQSKKTLSFARLKSWLNDAWNWIKEKLGIDSKADIENMTLDDFSDKAVKDLTGGKELKVENDLGNKAKNNNFAENNLVNNERTKTELDNRKPMERSAIRELVGEQPQGRRIEQTIENIFNRPGGTTANSLSQRWDKGRFLTLLEAAANENGIWIANIETVANRKQKLRGGFENEVYLTNDKENVIKFNNLNFLLRFIDLDISRVEKGQYKDHKIEGLEIEKSPLPYAGFDPYRQSGDIKITIPNIKQAFSDKDTAYFQLYKLSCYQYR